eukprot:m.79620 g.79620  ORF g.79620 m.79620 type:complete len:147 (-) comp20869_c0_seq1:67-507(-)
MLPQRRENLQQIGRILNQKFQGTFKTCISQAKNSAQKLLEIVLENFPCFVDKATYHEETIYLMKRAQILVADLWGCYQNESFGKFHDIDTLTMFADYRVPQILCQLELLSYDPLLLKRLNDGRLGRDIACCTKQNRQKKNKPKGKI